MHISEFMCFEHIHEWIWMRESEQVDVYEFVVVCVERNDMFVS